MDGALSIRDVARRTGISSRTLRYYEQRGLLRPLRTASGARWYDNAALTRLHTVLRLREAGLTLTEITAALDSGVSDLGDLLREAQARLASRQRDDTAALALIATALARIETERALGLDTLCALIAQSGAASGDDAAWRALAEHHVPPVALHELAALPPAAAWDDLLARIGEALPLDPASAEATGFVRQWFAILTPFSHQASPLGWSGMHAMLSALDHWPANSRGGLTSEIWHFINQATRAAIADGTDIGPVPSWMALPINKEKS